MTGEGRFIDTLGDGIKTKVPGGVDSEGPVKVAQSDLVQCRFDTTPLTVAKVGAGAAVGAAGDENLCLCGGVVWENHVLGTQTILAPSLGTYGLNVVQDEAENDGMEYCLGINANNKGVFTIGTSPAFYAKMKFYVDDVSGTDLCIFGFRKPDAYEAAHADYSDFAGLDVNSGNVLTHTNLNDGTPTETDTTFDFADTGIHEFGVYVSAAGVVTYTIDGSEPATVAAFTFDDGDTVVPYFHYLLAADPESAAIELIDFECGLQ